MADKSPENRKSDLVVEIDSTESMAPEGGPYVMTGDPVVAPDGGPYKTVEPEGSPYPSAEPSGGPFGALPPSYLDSEPVEPPRSGGDTD
ncbi:hypothetical protein ACQPZF_05405 [Actinosynnema sp. CS-041913]|uniref:hypothetical protein n=1 Tax=Actinosynnema sp. CS-041913 TaxID=3239917 RepID=UPI003D8CAE06